MPNLIADIELQCPCCKKWINVKVYKEKIKEAEFEFPFEVKAIQQGLFDKQEAQNGEAQVIEDKTQKAIEHEEKQEVKNV